MTDETNDRPKRITAQMKLKVYLETRAPEAPVGEILRRYGLLLPDLREIEETIEQAAITALKVNGARKSMPAQVSPDEYMRVVEELQQKERALADLTVEYQLFKKKQNLESELARKAKSFKKR